MTESAEEPGATGVPGATGDPFRVGVNYWPRRKAMGWWKAFDAGEVADEFDTIAGLGLGLVRLFLLWEDFQPRPDAVSEGALRDLEAVCTTAADRRLGLDVTFFTGHMSGPNWAPGWLLDGDSVVPGGRQVVSGGREVKGSYRNPFVDQVAIDGALLLLRTVVGRLHQHPAIWAWNLGNEPDLFALPPNGSAGPTWVRRMTDAIRELDGRHPVTIGLHLPDLLEDNGLRVDRMFAACDLAAMHAYPIYSPLAAGPLDSDFVPVVVAATAALSGRPVLAEELGAATAPPGEGTQTWSWQSRGRARSQVMLAEEDLAAHLEEVLPRLVEVGAVGALLWCFADYHQDLWERPPCDEHLHERFFGLVRPDGSLKPHAEVLRRFCETGPRVQEASARARFTLDPDESYADGPGTLVRLLELFRAA